MKSSLKNIPIILGISVLIGVLAMVIFCGGDCLNSWRMSLISSGYGAVLAFGLWMGNGLLSDWLSKIFPWGEKTMTRLVWGVLTSIIFSGIFVGIWHYIFFVEILGNSLEWYKRAFIGNITIALLITAFISLFLHAREFLNGWREAALKAERLQREQIQSRLQSLKDQLNPHFLFNSLNVLTTLVHKDADQAELFINKLAEIYRYVLEKTDHEVVPLRDELAFIKSYLALLGHRFGNNLIVNLDPPSVDNLYVPPLSLQLLIENAVKHNIISNKKPLTVSITEGEDGYLKVSNNLQPKSQTGPTSGVGLENIQARFAHLTDKPVIVTQTESDFSVQLPLLHQVSL